MRVDTSIKKGLFMEITIEIDSESDMEKLAALIKTFKMEKVKVVSAGDDNVPLTKGDKKIDPASLFGMWANKPRCLEDIRKDAWQRKADIA
jgi:hypothetical protein